MRLRAQLVNVNLLQNVVQSVEKWNHHPSPNGMRSSNQHRRLVYIHFTPTLLRFLCANPNEHNLSPLFAQISMDTVFEDILIESLHRNEIVLVMAIDLLLRALKSSSSSHSFSGGSTGGYGSLPLEIRMKLAKKNLQPVLTFQSTIQNRTSKTFTVNQSVPCEVIAPTEIENLKPPRMGALSLAIILPPLQALRTVVERMKTIDDRLIIAANGRGQLNFRVQTDLVQVTTYYQHLQHPSIEDEVQEQGNSDPDRFVETVVDIKQFARFLQVYHAQPHDTICCFYGDGIGVALLAYLSKTRRSGENAGVISYYLSGFLNN